MLRALFVPERFNTVGCRSACLEPALGHNAVRGRHLRPRLSGLRSAGYCCRLGFIGHRHLGIAGRGNRSGLLGSDDPDGGRLFGLYRHKVDYIIRNPCGRGHCNLPQAGLGVSKSGVQLEHPGVQSSGVEVRICDYLLRPPLCIGQGVGGNSLSLRNLGRGGTVGLFTPGLRDSGGGSNETTGLAACRLENVLRSQIGQEVR